MSCSGTLDLKAELRSYGVAASCVRALGEGASAGLLDYLDLVPQRRARSTNNAELLPDCVAESQDRPLLFVVNESRLAQSPTEQEQQIRSLRKKLASRGERTYLARLLPGEIKVIPVSLADRRPEWQVFTTGTPEALTFFSRLASGQFTFPDEPRDSDAAFSAMFELVWSVADRLAKLSLRRTDVLSLMGRALFFRFLCDRHVVNADDVNQIAPRATSIEECFSNAENAAATSAWLDRTFNGDLLPLSGNGVAFFAEAGRRTKDRLFIHLRAILRGDEPVGDEGYQCRLPFNFGHYDFAHVPVGLLSQVYEQFAWKWETENAKGTSVHYTPRNIAATLVGEAFAGLPKAHEARVLDPACGAGVFLVLAFRELYRARWEATGRRPDRKAIRQILDRQLCGFDISDSAIKLASLSLYLTAIELDPKPVPLEDLAFKCLRDAVLFNFRREGIDPADGVVAGSLGEHVGQHFDGKFDLVLCNPPWTSLQKGKNKLAAEVNQLSKAIIKRRGDDQQAAAYENPDFAPDLPFVWKSTEWCTPDGRIAIALPARILLKQEEIPRLARETLLRLVEVTGILSCTNLADTEVWPNMSQPFMLFFARNRKPKHGHTLRLITPQYDAATNDRGEMHIDSKSALQIELETTFDKPWIWKALALGTQLDADLIVRLEESFPQLGRYWSSLRLLSTTGYKVKSEGTPHDASCLVNLPDLRKLTDREFLVRPESLKPFERATVGRLRRRENYRAPLFLLKQSPGDSRTSGWSALCLSDVAFCQNFYGYSAYGIPQAELLTRYLLLFSHSFIWSHRVLITGSILGAERRVVYKTDFDDCPIVPFEKLTTEQRKEVSRLSARLIAQDTTVFDEIDVFFGGLFGLSARDMEVVRDTVEVAMPYAESRKRACAPPSSAERDLFRKRLELILRPFFKVTGDEPDVVLWKSGSAFLQQSAPFGLLLISKRGTKIEEPDRLFREAILKLAEQTGATRIIQEVDGGLVVALLNQYRYWTPSRARLLGAELVREHLDVFRS